MKVSKRTVLASSLLLLWGLGGCASIPTEPYEAYDPHEKTNRAVYGVFDAIDRRVLQPVARGYRRVTPDWVETGISNVFANLRDVDSALNGLLQGKPKQAGKDLGRVLFNSTVGFGGLIDVASREGWESGNEDFGQTLAVWGVTRSRYVYLPGAGPSTLRDVPGAAVQSAVPALLLGGGYAAWMSVLDLLSTRAEALTATDVVQAAALDPYVFTRDAYYQRRKFLVYDGDPPVEDFFFEFEDEDE